LKLFNRCGLGSAARRAGILNSTLWLDRGKESLCVHVENQVTVEKVLKQNAVSHQKENGQTENGYFSLLE